MSRPAIEKIAVGNANYTGDASWGTFVFTVLTLSQMGNALAVRSSRDSLFKIGGLVGGSCI